MTRSAGILTQQLQANNWTVVHTEIVPDDKQKIASVVTKWSATNCQLIVIAGGTGISPSDVTVDAIEPLFSKRLPSLAVAMVTGSLRITPMAALSQVTAGVVGCSVVVAVPGSKKGSVEICSKSLVFSRTLSTLRQPHRDQAFARGAAQGKNTRVQCGCSRPDDADDNQAETIGDQGTVAGRPRKMVIGSMQALPPRDMLLSDVRPGMEPCPRTGHPSWTATLLWLQTDRVTTNAMPLRMNTGSIVRVATGAPVPEGADAVVMVEDTQLLQADNQGEELVVRILAGVQPGQYIRPVGHDVSQGAVLLKSGTVVSPVGGEIGTMAVSGNRTFSVHTVPRIAVMSTGDELSESPGELGHGHVRDSNRPHCSAPCARWGSTLWMLAWSMMIPHCWRAKLLRPLRTAMRDWVKPVVEQHLKGRILFGRVAMKPAKPSTFAVLPGGKFIFALPGNPASAMVAFHVFSAPALRKLSGHQKYDGARLRPCFVFVRGRLAWSSGRDKWLVYVTDAHQQSSRMPSMLNTNALACAGDQVNVIVIAPPAFE
ncbi:MoaB/Mog domain-containing protein [Kickxella alabastrina]|uniref:MoaB/Mog domain-containing protein n=1 Tax=Kickxella alabastrina TaxID=61397 RepID=UPI00221FF635|nr:MoaB/Mog domain-containing protein [Kickxella alabastrina]KAI7826271.1 MoaB/Mog domain-containing protein [Kickxella alabastrina]